MGISSAVSDADAVSETFRHSYSEPFGLAVFFVLLCSFVVRRLCSVFRFTCGSATLLTETERHSYSVSGAEASLNVLGCLSPFAIFLLVVLSCGLDEHIFRRFRCRSCERDISS